MTTSQRAEAVARACAQFEPLLGETTPEILLRWVEEELGHAAALDALQPIGGRRMQAIPPATILHIVSGNTPHAALQTLVRGTVLGSYNLCKLPGAGLPEARQFADALPPELRARVEFATELPADWLERADAVIVFGGDDTIAHFHKLTTARQVFLGYGHRVSLAIVWDDPEFASVEGAALDASLFDQQGCLSPHCIYVAREPEQYAARLADAMAGIEKTNPRSALTVSESAAIADTRETFRFKAATGSPIRLWQSKGSDAWTVIYDGDPRFVPSPLNRVIFVRPFPADPTEIAAALEPARRFLSTIGIWPATQQYAELTASLGPTRICPLGKMQLPPWTWRHDGRATLARLVTWRVCEL